MSEQTISRNNIPVNANSMPLIDYAEWLLKSGRYDVDVNTGVATNLRTSRHLKPILDSEGYLYVDLACSRTVQRPLRIHRLIAIKAFGADAVRGMHVAHKDQNKLHNSIGNFVVISPQDHPVFDGNHNHAKTEWSNCARCGTHEGTKGRKHKTPDRINGKRFGFNGELCGSCYASMRKRAIRRGVWVYIVRRGKVATNA
jgi:hypothetical protein